jgi:CRP/FNR family transcriptional regulator, cyclic AMP receptor protein
MAGARFPPKRELLRSLQFFSKLDERDIDSLAGHARTERHPAGSLIFAKGSPGRSMMTVLHGSVRISSSSASGKEVVLNIVNPGEVFGEIALLDGRERTADAVAIADCDLLVLDRRDFLPVLLGKPEFCVALLELLCRRLRQTSVQVEDALFEKLDSRMAKALLRLAGAAKEAAVPAPVPIRISQQQLANMVGASREGVNRMLRIWERDGIVELKKGSIVIHETGRLIEP